MSSVNDLVELSSISENTTYSTANGTILGVVDGATYEGDPDNTSADVQGLNNTDQNGGILTIGGVQYNIVLVAPAGEQQPVTLTSTSGTSQTLVDTATTSTVAFIQATPVSGAGPTRYFAALDDSVGNVNVSSIQTRGLDFAPADSEVKINLGENNDVKGSGNDQILASQGGSRTSGEGGDDSIDGTTNDDSLHGGEGNDTLSGGDGEDTLDGDVGNDRLRGGAGNDSLNGWYGYDTLEGGDGNDTVDGGEGDDVVAGGAGDDTVVGWNGHDTLDGNDGNDLIDAGAGRDYIRGGDGNDTIHAGDGHDYALGGAENDKISGGSGDDTLDGDVGDDSIQGDIGDDSLIGWYGSDTLDGGEGADTITGGDDADTLIGWNGNDSLSGDAGNDYIDAGRDDDVISGGRGNDTLLAGHGNDAATGGADDDYIRGGEGNDTLLGEAGKDTLNGDVGDDTLDGGDGDDILSGGDGGDRLTGGLGGDTLTGGSGNDIFGYTADGNIDTITDFNTGNTGATSDGDQTNNDFIDLGKYYDNLSQMRADFDDDGILNQSNSVDANGRSVSYGEKDSLLVDGKGGIRFQNIQSSDLTTDNTGVVCFARGTRILTPGGEVAVHQLVPGDLVVTQDAGAQPVLWIGHRRLSAADLDANPNLRPILIPACALGNGLPVRDLTVSPQHRVLVRSRIARRMFDQDEVLVAAKHLIGCAGIREIEDAHGIEYWHFMFDRHHVVWSEGATTESLFTGPEAIKSVGEAARREIFELFPHLQDASFEPARMLVKGRMGRTLAMRHEKNHVSLYAS